LKSFVISLLQAGCKIKLLFILNTNCHTIRIPHIISHISNVQHPVQSGFYNRNLKPTLITQFVEEIIANTLENY
jgi:hypothetical protein